MAGLYIHIPFCTRKCIYCDFYSCTQTDKTDAFVEALLSEMDARREYLKGEPLHTIYFGGGTPSLLSSGQIGQIIDRALDLFGGDPQEITIEANPDDLTPEYLDALASTRVNRLSIGIQSFNERDLKLMNRRHSAQQAVYAVRDARRAGFDNITIDLIYGIPGMSDTDWEQNLRRAAELNVEHISAYHLSIEEGTPLALMAAHGKIAPVDDSVSERQYAMLREHLAAMGFEHYEISNFARPGRHASHNSSYWHGRPYLGLGPSAHSYNGDERLWAAPSLERYLAQTASKEIYTTETLSPADKYNEYVMTRLRCTAGIDLNELAAEFGPERRNYLTDRAEELINRGILLLSGRKLHIPPEKFLISDRIISELFID